MRGLLKLADKHDTALAGGDTSESPDGILADIVVIGSVPAGTAVRRSGARVGDGIYVTGQLGASAAALAHMRKEPKKKVNPQSYPRHFFPEPRLEAGEILRQNNLASSMIDLSDGLSTDLAHICEESGVGAELLAQAIPHAITGKPATPVDLRLALHGGEDYELLFTAPAGKRIPSQIVGVPVTEIGKIIRGKKMFLRDSHGKRHQLQPRGWEHFHD